MGFAYAERLAVRKKGEGAVVTKQRRKSGCGIGVIWAAYELQVRYDKRASLIDKGIYVNTVVNSWKLFSSPVVQRCLSGVSCRSTLGFTPIFALLSRDATEEATR